MPKLSDLLAEKAKGTIDIGGSKLNIIFHVMLRAQFTDEEWDALLAITGRDYYKALLPKVLIDWDLVDADGTKININAAAFDEHEIPDVLLAAVEQRIFGSDLSGKVLPRTSSSSSGS